MTCTHLCCKTSPENMFCLLSKQMSIFYSVYSKMSVQLVSYKKLSRFQVNEVDLDVSSFKKTINTPKPRIALLMCQEKYSAIRISAIGNY